ncbi:MAG: 50S ribosomal protein L1 [Armatimonadota bacterium]
MRGHSARYMEQYEKVDREQYYGLEEAIELVKEMATAGFDETVEMHVKLQLEGGKGEKTVRDTLTLPHGTGNVPTVVVFAEGEAVREAEEAGADRVGSDDLISDIEEGWEDFDILVAHPSMMPKVGPLGRILGPRMPSKKAGNITEDVATAVERLKAGRMEFRADRGGVIHLAVGKVSFDAQEIAENITAAIDAIRAARPVGVTGKFIYSVTICSSMSPGVKIDTRELMTKA